MFIIVVRHTRPPEEMAKAEEAHRAFLNRHFGNGDFIVAGPTQDRAGDLIVTRRKTRAEAEKIIEKDPYKTAGMAEYELIEFNPAKYADGFQKYF